MRNGNEGRQIICARKKCPHCKKFIRVRAIQTVEDGEYLDEMNTGIEVEKVGNK